jgi:hypothetical protein
MREYKDSGILFETRDGYVLKNVWVEENPIKKRPIEEGIYEQPKHKSRRDPRYPGKGIRSIQAYLQGYLPTCLQGVMICRLKIYDIIKFWVNRIKAKNSYLNNDSHGYLK